MNSVKRQIKALVMRLVGRKKSTQEILDEQEIRRISRENLAAWKMDNEIRKAERAKRFYF